MDENQHEERWAALIQALPDLLFRMDAAGVFVDFFAPEQAALAVAPEQIIGRSVEDSLPPDVAEITRKHLGETLATGNLSRFDYRLQLPGGDRDFEARMAVSGPSEVLVIVRDVTELRLLERERVALDTQLKAQKRLQSVIEAIPSGILIADQKWQLTHANRAAVDMFGYQLDELRGVPLKKLIPTANGLLMARLRNTSPGKTSRAFITTEFLATRKDERSFPAEFSLNRFADGDNDGFLAIVTDISQRKLARERQNRLELAIQQTQKLESLGVLAGGIAHDFNNLLVGILGYADLALRALTPLSPARELIANIKESGRRAADLCDQMLAYSGKGRFVIQALDLVELIEDMTHLLKVSISKNVVLKFNFPDNIPAVEGDATQLRQVIMNLVINGSEAIGGKSGVISISVGAMRCDWNYLNDTFYPADGIREGLYAYFEVSDTGTGMDETTRKRIFDPFYTTKFAGRGLGLSAVIGICRGHKGTIKVYSERSNGTSFKVLLPAIDRPSEALAVEVMPPENWTGAGAILLVDDDETVLAIGSLALQSVGFSVLTARDGVECLEMFAAHRDDIVCVMLDLTMPHMDGEEAFRELRRIQPDVRVILCSGYNEQDVTNRFVGKGLAGFIKKPYDMGRLFSKIREVLEYEEPDDDSA